MADDAITLEDSPVETARSISTEAAAPEKKRARYDDSSDDDDYYSNFDNFMKKNSKPRPDLFPKSNLQPKRASTPKLDTSSESDSDIEEAQEEMGLASLLAKAQKFNEDREKQIEAEIKKIAQLAEVEEAGVGARPDFVYLDTTTREAEKKLRRLKEDAMEARRMSTESSNRTDVIVIDANGERREREYGYGGASSSRVRYSGLQVSFLLQDLHKNSCKIEKFDYDTPIRCFVRDIAQRWECGENEVVLTMGDKVITELDYTPRAMDIPLDGIHDIKAVYVPVKKDKKEIVDENAIKIKFQSGQGRPVFISVNKNEPFSSMLDRIATELKMEKVEKLIFDCERVDLSLTPVDLDMDDEDCMDVYAAV